MKKPGMEIYKHEGENSEGLEESQVADAAQILMKAEKIKKNSALYDAAMAKLREDKGHIDSMDKASKPKSIADLKKKARDMDKEEQA